MYFKSIQSKKNGLNTPPIFHCYLVICRKISVNDAKMVCLFIKNKIFKFGTIILTVYITRRFIKPYIQSSDYKQI